LTATGNEDRPNAPMRLSASSRSAIALSTSAMVVLVAIYLPASTSTVEDWEDGLLILNDYEYIYDALVTNVTGPYEVVLPVPLMRDGRVIPEIDFSSGRRIELSCSTWGWGLRVVGDHDLNVHLEGRVENLRNSESIDRGFPFLSTLMGDVNLSGPLPAQGHVWVFSNHNGLRVTLRVDVVMSRSWVNRAGETSFRDGIGWAQRMDCMTPSGWSMQGLDIRPTFVT